MELSIPISQIAVPFVAPFQVSPVLLSRLKNWNPHLDPTQLTILSSQAVTWNDGSLGAPMPGKYYTQALVPGFRLVLEHGNEIFEVHANRAMTSFAIPGYGFI